MPRSIAWLGLAVSLVGGCGGSGGGSGAETGDTGPATTDRYIRATITATDGSQLRYDEPAEVSNIGFMWFCEAVDPRSGYLFLIAFNDMVVVEPKIHVADQAIDEVMLWVGNPEEDPGFITVGMVDSGLIQFDEVDYTEGGVIAGTFDGVAVRRDGVQGPVDVQITAGEFRCPIPENAGKEPPTGSTGATGDGSSGSTGDTGVTTEASTGTTAGSTGGSTGAGTDGTGSTGSTGGTG